jgi:Uma2 family endonuclease
VTEERLEYIDGVVYAMGSPSIKHQRIVVEISNLFYNFFKGKKCKHYVAPLDVHFENSESKACVQPDVLVICDEENIRDGKYYGVPSIVVEILSQATKSKDTITKLNLYWREGVREYLLIDPIKEQIFYWYFDERNIVDQGVLKVGEAYTSNAFEGLNFEIAELF